MFVATIKYLAIIYASIYAFVHILNIGLSKKQVLYHIVFSILTSVLVAYTRAIIPQYTYLLIINLMIIFTHFIYRNPLYITIISCIISLAISCLISIITIIINVFFYMTINMFIYETDVLHISTFAFMHIFAISLIFKIKRLKNGMPFIKNLHHNDTGIIIGLASITFISLFTPQRAETNYIMIIPLIILIFSGFYIIAWWRQRITQKYSSKLQEREVNTLKYEISEMKSKIEYLRQQNESLSKIIHKDNKLIPAMELAISQLISLFTNNTNTNVTKQADQILAQLKIMSLQRKGIVESYEAYNHSFPLTSIITIDSLLMLMEKKSSEHSIEYKVNIDCDFNFLKDNKSLENDLLTLLADLIENAVIATKDSETKHILINFLYDGCFVVEIYDSGNPFPGEVIEYIGIKRTTTHKKSGGSGIGLMTSYKLLQKHSASLIIEELYDDSKYKKKICILFNNINQIIIRTNHSDILLLKDKRTDLLFESKKTNRITA